MSLECTRNSPEKAPSVSGGRQCGHHDSFEQTVWPQRSSALLHTHTHTCPRWEPSIYRVRPEGRLLRSHTGFSESKGPWWKHGAGRVGVSLSHAYMEDFGDLATVPSSREQAAAAGRPGAHRGVA